MVPVMEASSTSEMQVTLDTQLGSFQLPQTNKRTPEMVSSAKVQLQPSIVCNFGALQLPMVNKKPPQMEASSKLCLRGTVSSGASQQLPIMNKLTSQMQSSPKAQPQAVESVRSKMRESLAAALELACQSQDSLPNAGKDHRRAATAVCEEEQADAQLVKESSSSLDMHTNTKPESLPEAVASKEENDQTKDESQTSLHSSFINDNKLGIPNIQVSGQEFDSKQIFLGEEASYIIKDVLLQGNGLCWASDLDLESFETIATRECKRPKIDQNNNVVQNERGIQLRMPETLASEIEAELFKLFGGVNKKYKEKGRSLLFNLKDHNNPELRERVISGEIPPEKLCGMNAEELASKELSQWRIAKAEEMAHMVILPDAEVDIRRLVRKTHKGEFQVEIEQDDSVSVEVAIGETSLPNMSSRNNESETKKPTKAYVYVESDKVDECHDNLTDIPHDNANLMQGLMVEEELKDTNFLPPIVSLDEFMDSLNAYPPFENLSGNADQVATASSAGEKKGDDKGPNLGSSTSNFASTANASPPTLPAKEDENTSENKSNEISQESGTGPAGSKSNHVWDGLLQLNISSIVHVIGVFKSGEKTSTKDWPTLLKVKGRVRLDAFGKFLQDLPLSRSRAFMVVQFVCKEGSPESGGSNLSEAVDSYISDERVGLVEPASGVELYFWPSHDKTVEKLCNLLPKDHSETLKTIDSGLIGIVVWRRPQVTSALSPKTYSHRNQNSRKQRFSTTRIHRQEKDVAARPNLPANPVGAHRYDEPNVASDENDDDGDIPPGFGPMTIHNEVDLPEFQFGTGPNLPSNPSRSSGMVSRPSEIRQLHHPVEQVRELIQKYGQSTQPNLDSGSSSQSIMIEMQPWNDDDDDDIPEWRPKDDTQSFPLMPRPPIPNNRQHSVSSNAVTSLQSLQVLKPSMQMLSHPLPSNMAARSGQQNVPPSWQQSRSWPRQYGDTGISESRGPVASRRPCQFGGPDMESQLYRMPRADWRPRY